MVGVELIYLKSLAIVGVLKKLAIKKKKSTASSSIQDVVKKKISLFVIVQALKKIFFNGIIGLSV